MKQFRNLLYLFILFLIFGGCNKDNAYVKCEGIIWNTLYHITYKGGMQLSDSISKVLNEVTQSLSVFDNNSLVSQLNKNDSVVADFHLIAVYDKSKEVFEKSKHRFDPTLSPLIDAWGFGRGHEATIDTLAIDSVMQYVGIEKTERRDDVIIKEDQRTQFNFSAIAKGYGCDAIGEMFKRNGVNDYMIEIGGEIVLKGNSPSGGKWRIGIDAPKEGINPGEEAVMVLTLTDVGVATSGNYRNYREEGGRKVAHTISRVTGRPFQSEILSATVIAPTCMEADALATACMAGNTEEAKELLEETGAQGLLIFADSLWESPGFKKFYEQ